MPNILVHLIVSCLYVERIWLGCLSFLLNFCSDLWTLFWILVLVLLTSRLLALTWTVARFNICFVSVQNYLFFPLWSLTDFQKSFSTFQRKCFLKWLLSWSCFYNYLSIKFHSLYDNGITTWYKGTPCYCHLGNPAVLWNLVTFYSMLVL